MIRWKSLALGAAVFAAAHGVEMAFWAEWFQPGGGYAPWFLNAGRAVAFTAGCLFVAGALLGFGRRGLPRESIVAGGNLALGAAAAMAVVLAVVGPGTLYPLALALGACVCLVSGAGGAFAGSAFRTIFGR